MNGSGQNRSTKDSREHGSPEQRYAQLHRDLERGVSPQQSHVELARTCIELGKIGEAARMLRDVQCPQTLQEITRLLASHGVIAHELSSVHRAVRPTMPPVTGQTASGQDDSGGISRQPIGAAANEGADAQYVRKPLPPVGAPPSASEAALQEIAPPTQQRGPDVRQAAPLPADAIDPSRISEQMRTDPSATPPAPVQSAHPLADDLAEAMASRVAGADTPTNARAVSAKTPYEVRALTRDAAKKDAEVIASDTIEDDGVVAEVQDAGLFLLKDHMPVLILVLTLAFPLASALTLLVPESWGYVSVALQALAPLGVLALFLHMAARVLDGAIDGDEDPAPFSDLFHGLPMGAIKACGAVVALCIVGFGPAFAAYAAGLASAEAAVLGFFGFAYIPLAALGLRMRGTIDAAMPAAVLRAMMVSRLGYMRLTFLCTVIMLLPCLAIAIGAGSAMILQSALAGPLFVVPGFLLARCIGRYGYEHRAELNRAFGVVVEQLAHDPRAHARALAKRRVQQVTQADHTRREPAPHMPRTVATHVRTVTESREIAVNAPQERKFEQSPLGAAAAQQPPAATPQAAPAPVAQRALAMAVPHRHDAAAHAAEAARAEELDRMAAEQVRQHYAQQEAAAARSVQSALPPAPAAPRARPTAPQARPQAQVRPPQAQASPPQAQARQAAQPRPQAQAGPASPQPSNRRPVARDVQPRPEAKSVRRSAMPKPAPRSGVYPTQIHDAGTPQQGLPTPTPRPVRPHAVPPAQQRGVDPRRGGGGTST